MCATCPTYLTLLHFIFLIISDELLNMQFSPSCYLLLLSHKYFPQNPVLGHPVFFFNLTDQGLYPHKISTVRISWILIFVSVMTDRKTKQCDLNGSKQKHSPFSIVISSSMLFYLFMHSQIFLNAPGFKMILSYFCYGTNTYSVSSAFTSIPPS